MAEPAPSNSHQTDKIFEIGVVMAGAISAGAYTAGVADFLIEALDEWYKFNKPRGSSPHEVKLRVISGASAGGMTGSILTAAFGGDFPPIHDRPAEESKNPLYRAWVQQIDIEHLLQSKDVELIRSRGEVEKQRELRRLRRLRHRGRISPEAFQEKLAGLSSNTLVSLLDSTKLCEIADKAVDVKPNPAPLLERRPYLPDRFELYLSIANLRGVPYLLELQGGRERMIMHADFMHFALTTNEPEDLTYDSAGNQYVMWSDPHDPNLNIGHAFWLNPAKYHTENWKTLSRAALATGAFPFGLAPVKLQRIWDEYKYRTFPVSTYKNGSYSQVFQVLQPEPNRLLKDTDAYEFVCVDGGLLDNAPFDLAHRALTDKLGQGNERDPRLSDRAIILLAPFPDSKEPERYQEPTGLLAYGSAILDSLMKQVRFDPEELILASDPNIGSRYLISPAGSKNPVSDQGDIACGTLGGFGGFLSEDFRHHDFILGRRNCQRFLEQYFILPENNPLFSHWDADLRRDFYVKPSGKTIKITENYLPIIPLVGSAARQIDQPDWPSYSTSQLDKLLGHFQNRFTSVSRFLIDMYAGGFVTKNLLRFGVRSQKAKVLRSVRTMIKDSLVQYGIQWKDAAISPWRSRTRMIIGVLALAIGVSVALLAIGIIGG